MNSGGGDKVGLLGKLPPWAMPAAIGLLTLVLFGDALVVPGRVPSEAGSDLRCQYLYWRQFAFEQIKAGHFPLWNPYAFCGTPFFGDPQSALLYPPNWLYLLLPPALATSWLIALHFFCAGWFSGIWCRLRGLSVEASILAGVIYACCGPIITNLRPGHVPLLCSAAWAPLLFCCVDGILAARDGGRRRWVLAGIGVVAMLAVDGFPQFAYYSALAVGLYALLRLPEVKGRWSVVAALGVMFLGGWAVAAAQIMASAQAAGESIRAGGLSFAAAAEYSLPPENLLTLLVPGLFGDAVHLMYYGRWYWWETCLFIGPAAVALAALGAVQRRAAAAVAMVGLMLLLALGSSTPLFGLLYHWLPGFSSFRATTRFSLPAELFLALLAAMGWDRLLIQSRGRKIVAGSITIMGLLLCAASVWAMNADFSGIIHNLAATHQTMEAAPLVDPTFPAQAASMAARELGVAGVAALLAGGLMFAAARHRTAAIVLAMVVLGQLICFAAMQRASSDASVPIPDNWAKALVQVPAGNRVMLFNNSLAEAGGSKGFLNASGFNPLVLGRTARFLAATQDGDPESVGVRLPLNKIPSIYRMLRCCLILPPRLGGPVFDVSDPLPRLMLSGEYVVAGDSKAALGSVLDENFNPARSVVLESPPIPAPREGDASDSVRLLGETTDEMEIEADLREPQVLLITDAYSAGWRVVPLEARGQAEYQVMPGDYCLRAIPLAAGHHHFRLEYRPGVVIAGEWISLASLVIYGLAIVATYRFRASRAP